jgi:hypothetical protein
MEILSALEAFSYGMFGDTSKLQRALNGDISIETAHRSIDVVRLQLRDAIANGAVTARGYRGDPNQLTPEIISPELFQLHRALAVDMNGETIFLPPASPKHIARCQNVTFERKQIQNLWTKADAALDAWMAKDFEETPIKKRAARLDDCKRSNPCTDREAQAAYGRIPPDKKLRRGQRLTVKQK